MAVKEANEFKEMELWEHLQELRGRLIRSVVYVFVGLAVAWALYGLVYQLFMAPLKPIMDSRGWKIFYSTITQGFMLQLQVSLVAGLVIAVPLVTLEAWGFIAPGLTRNERKACYLVVPTSIVFFLMGCVCGYLLMPVTLSYFAQFIPKDGILMQNPIDYLLFTVKMVVGFGVCFQLPIILMLLAWLGLVTSSALVEQWRMAAVGCFVVAAVATPGGDPLTMCVLASPLAILYVASIFLVRIVEKARAKSDWAV